MPSKFRFTVCAFLLYAPILLAQEDLEQLLNKAEIHGDFQSDFQYYQDDKALESQVQQIPEKMGSNSYLNLSYSMGNLRAGLRYEAYFPALAGFDRRYNGSGIANRFVTYDWKGLEVTAGHFYEQFGSGITLRTYQDWNLGYDNAIDGFRVVYNGLKGVKIKGLVGTQRLYFSKGEGTVRGADAEVSLNDVLPCMTNKKLMWQIGGSFVSKYQADNDPLLKLPENVATWGLRSNWSIDKLTFYAEYAAKNNDPSFVNSNIYKAGNALLFTGSYAGNGLGISVGAKRIDNMDFRSDRNASINDVLINYLPPLTPQHTYRLVSLYPYVTQPLGEMALQAEISYNIPEVSALGGKFGSKVTANWSRVNNIDKTPTNNRLGYTSDFMKFGDQRYFENVSVDINRKLNEKTKITAAYIYTELNNNVLRLSDFKGTIYSHSVVVNVLQKLASRRSISINAEWMGTEQERGSWASLALEFTEKWFFAALSDDYNYGNPEKGLDLHYMSGTVGVKKGATRFSTTFGRQRAGVICVGGICRLVPATSGLTLSLSSSF